MRERIRPDVGLVGASVAIGLALRIAVVRQGLWGDELLAYRDIDHTLRGMFGALRSGPENSPPLFFVLAWFSRKLGGDPALIRLPSIVLGTATIPLVAWLGRRTVGPWAGVVAAWFVALAPPAIYYSVEGRPYATLMFGAALSALLLLVALERATTRWWVAYGLSLAAIVYTHYTGVFVVATELGWALWVMRRAPRGVLVAAISAALAFAPWLPFVKGEELGVYYGVAKFLGLTRTDALITWLTGLPYEHPDAMPGLVSLTLLGAALLLGVGGVLFWMRHGGRPSARTVLVLVLAAATPVGILAYSVLRADLFVFPRNLLASLPFAALAFAWLLLRLPTLAAGPALALATVGLGIGSAATVSDAHSRPDYPQLADYVDAVAAPGTVVVYHADRASAETHTFPLHLYVERPHPEAFEPDPGAWARQLRAGRVVVVGWGGIGWSRHPLLPGPGLTKVDERLYGGIQPLVAAVYRPDPLRGLSSYSVHGDRLVPARGRSLPIARGGVEGEIERVGPAPRGAVLYRGWAHRDHWPVDKIVAFAGGVVVYADAPSVRRRELAGNDSDGSSLGFEFQVPSGLLTERVSAYALWHGAAYRLERR